MATPGETLPALAHFSWCAQVALRLAIQDGLIHSPLDEHLFLLNWIVTAKTQKRFPKMIGTDIDNLISHASRLGIQINLLQQLHSIYIFYMFPMVKKTDRLRFSYVIESLRLLGWQDFSISRKDGLALEKFSLDSRKNVIFIEYESLNKAFDAEGRQISIIELKLSGPINKIIELFVKQDFYCNYVNETQSYYLLFINTSPVNGK
ncbi:DUF2913 family protein [Sodalis sp. RH24]|uniref:DUF2913 family protein n=1 Tax=unclassified Sodalis (in: enterobacteria) TaxID=2636512 RepID=UPI0039B3C91D